MPKIHSWSVILIACVLTVSSFAQQPAPRSLQAAQEAEGQAALAERLIQQAGDVLLLSRGKDGRPPIASMRQAAALTEAAMRLAPGEPRYASLLAQTDSALGDVSGEIAAWTAYRRLLPDDRFAQTRVIELYMTRIETADGKLSYLKDLLNRESIAPELKAHIAALAVPLLEQRSHTEAVAMIHQARQYYPLCEVLWMEHSLLGADASPAQRVASLVAMLKANPAQPMAVYGLAHELTLAGLHEQATQYYALTGSLLGRMQLPADLGVAIEAGANLYRIGQVQPASQFVETLSTQQLYPDAPTVWFLKLTFAHGAESPEQLRVTRNAVNKGIKSLADLMSKAPPAAGDASATQPSPAPATLPTTAPATAPTSQPTPDALNLTALAAKAKEINNARVTAELAEALSDRAWLEIYYARDPSAAVPAIEALKALLPAGDVTLVRLSGWYDLAANKLDDARNEFSSVADKDSLSLLGLYQLEEKAGNKEKADQIGSQLLSEPTAGLLNAIVYQAVKAKNYSPTTRPATAEVSAELQKLPQDWMAVVQQPQAGVPPPPLKFYQLKAEPLHSAHHLGEPMLVRLTLSNIGKYDLSIGSNGVGLIQPQLLFDIQTRGVVQQGFPAIAFERLLGRTILRSGETITQIMRIDQGELGAILRRTPVGLLSLDGDAVLNPVEAQDGLHLGPGGLYVPFVKLISRTSEPLSSEPARDKFFTAMNSDPPAQKLLALDTLAAYVRAGASLDPESPDKAVVNRYLAAIVEARADSSPDVASWAGSLSAELVDAGEKQKVIEQMTASQAWENRLIGLLQSRWIPAAPRKKIAGRLAAGDPDVFVKSFAAATLEAPELPLPAPTSAPATQPAGVH